MVWNSLYPPAASRTHAANGKSAVSICRSADATPAEQWAAEELQRYVAQKSGARLAVQTACDANREIDDFLSGVYGQAATPFRLSNSENSRHHHVWRQYRYFASRYPVSH